MIYQIVPAIIDVDTKISTTIRGIILKPMPYSFKEKFAFDFRAESYVDFPKEYPLMHYER